MNEFKNVREVPLQFRPGWYYHTIFYFPIPPMESHLLGGNVMGLVWRLEEEPGCWRMTYRMRYYNSSAVDDPKDTRSWYGFHAKGDDTPAKFLKTARMFYEKLVPFCFATKPNEPDRFDTVTIEGDYLKVFEVLAREKKPWANFIKADPVRAAKLTKEFGL